MGRKMQWVAAMAEKPKKVGFLVSLRKQNEYRTDSFIIRLIDAIKWGIISL